MRLRLFLAIPALLAASVAAHADTYQYDVTLFGQTAIFDESSILTAYTRIEPSSFLAGSSTDIDYLDINPTAGNCPWIGGGNACIDMFLDPPFIDSATFIDGPMTTPGVSYNDGSLAIVTFTDVSAVAATPEPSTLMLLGSGLLAIAVFARRRLAGSPRLL